MAYLGLSSVNSALAPELARAGFEEGRNLTLGSAPTSVEELPERAAEIVATGPDVILAGGDAPARAAVAATKSIPIVAISDNLISSGLMASLARPDGNLTGVNIFGNELNGKRQELLIDLMPRLKRLAILVDPSSTTPDMAQILSKAAHARGIDCTVHSFGTVAGIIAGIQAARAGGAQALNILASALVHSRRADVIREVMAARLPAIFQWPEYVREGALIGYGPRLELIYRKLVAQQVIRLLKGAKTAEIPAEQPTDFELGVNLKAAKSLGLTFPPTLLARADEVIE